MAQVPDCLAPQDEDIEKMLACQVHVGSDTLDNHMRPYVWKRRGDGVYLLNLGKTWEKLMLAARVIAAIDNPKDVCVVTSRPVAQRAVLKYARYTGASTVAGRFTPGTFTNQIQAKFQEPRVLVITDPHYDGQAVRESAYVNTPVIAFCTSETPTEFVDIVIPVNNKGRTSIGLMYWLLAREVLRLRGELPRTTEWEIMTDLFFQRTAEDEEREQLVAKASADYAAPATSTAFVAQPEFGASAVAPGATGDWADAPVAPAGGDWGAKQDWGAAAPGAPAAEWGAAPLGPTDNTMASWDGQGGGAQPSW